MILDIMKLDRRIEKMRQEMSIQIWGRWNKGGGTEWSEVGEKVPILEVRWMRSGGRNVLHLHLLI